MKIESDVAEHASNKALQPSARSTLHVVPCEAVRAPAERGR